MRSAYPASKELLMPRIIRMPSGNVLPAGGRRSFLYEVFRLYRQAGSPALKEVEKWIKENDNLDGTASSETIRRLLTLGKPPYRWHTAEAVILAFCHFARIDPEDDQRFSTEFEDVSFVDHMRFLWGEAMDEDPDAAPPQPSPKDPWDEPPF
jgi:hypothetical protein